MKIQLLLANQEVELTKQVQIPLNKSFQNLWNPTDIIVDYSKSVSIPMTINNNRILGNAYRLDRSVIASVGNDNIGIHLDPTKKIPFKLMYDNQEMMSGYAKFVSADYSSINKSYNLNLFGTLGGYFQTLKEVVTSSNRLSDSQKEEADGGAKYVLNDHCSGGELNSAYVTKSWLNTNNNTNDFSDPTITDQDIIGFAPAYRGLYGMDFKSSEIQINKNEFSSLSSHIESKWKDSYCIQNWGSEYNACNNDRKQEADEYVSKLGASDVVGDGMKDYQMGEYRSYHQRPYIYINKLFYMFQEKSKELTGFDLEFDSSWFNKNNPYWTKLVYTLNYLEDLDELPKAYEALPIKTIPITFNAYPTNELHAHSSTSYTTVPNSKYLTFNPNIKMDVRYDNRLSNYTSYYLFPSFEMAFVYEFKLTCGNQNITKRFWSSNGRYSYCPNVEGLTEENRVYTTWKKYDSNGAYVDFIKCEFEWNTPFLTIEIPNGYEKDVWDVELNIKMYSPRVSPISVAVTLDGYSSPDFYEYADISKLSGNSSIKMDTATSASLNAVNVGLSVLYLDENPIFDIILQYTKMYGLMWKVDEVGRKITICRKSTYFKDYTIENWDNKLDRSKDYKVEPITFGSRYVNFNYEDVDGYKYGSYKDKYGVPYGIKKLRTTYDFDTDDNDLFSNINPSIVSQRNYTKYSDIRNWNLSDSIPTTSDKLTRIESVDSDDTKATNNSSWYFRLENIPLDDFIYITDDSSLMNGQEKYCWYDSDLLETYYFEGDFAVRRIKELPKFHLVANPKTNPMGCIFSCPKEDYTLDKSIANAKGRYIYDVIWDDYINERYSIQNKKLTAYFNICPHDYLGFDFKRFITLDNQLFIINKIFDYDVNSSATTKCELIQVTDISAYTTDTLMFGLFEQEYTFTINPIPSNATIYINGRITDKVNVSLGATVEWEVKANGYISKSGTHVVSGNEVLTVELEKEQEDIKYIFQINPVPQDATVTINGVNTNVMEVPAWSEVNWSVSKSGYQTKTGTTTVTRTEVITVYLVEEGKDTITFTINPTPSDANVWIEGEYVNSKEFGVGAWVRWSVSKSGYVTQSDTVGTPIYEDTTLDIELVRRNEGDYTFTINPTPSNATVKMGRRNSGGLIGEREHTGIGRTTISTKGGDDVSWSVSADGYERRAGMRTGVSGDIEFDVVLERTAMSASVTSVNSAMATGSQQILITSNTEIDANSITFKDVSQTNNGYCTLTIVSNEYNTSLQQFRCVLLLDWNFVTNGSYSSALKIENLNSSIAIPINITVSDMGDPDKIASIGLARMDNNYKVSYSILIGNFAYDKVELALSADGTDSGIVEYFDVTNELTGIIDNGLAGVPYLILYIDDIIYDIKEITNV